MALLRTLETLKAGERIHDELFRATTRDRPASAWLARPLDPWSTYRQATGLDKRAVTAR